MSVPAEEFRMKAPEPAEPRPFRFPDVTRTTLDNGLRLLVANRETAPLVSMRLVVRSGADRDPRDLAGLASLTSEMLDEGAGGRSAIDIAEEVADLGASLGTGADWDASYVYLMLLDRNLLPGAEIFADVVQRPDFPSKELDRVRRERLTEIRQQRDEPAAIASLRFSRFVYGESPYARPLIGDEASVRAIGAEDVAGFFRDHYLPNNASLIITGRIDRVEAKALAERFFGGWQRGTRDEGAPIEPPAAVQPHIYVIDRPEAVQSEIRVGHAGVPRSCEDYFPLMTMNALLGGVFTSRLNLNLRERHGYTYGIRSAFAFRRHAGPFVVSTAVRNAVTADATNQILFELDRIRQGEVTAEELADTKNYLMGVFPATVQSAGDLANRLQEMELYDLPEDYFDHYRARIEEVTPEEVRRVAEKYLDPENATIVIVGKASEVAPTLSSLGRPFGLYDLEGNPVVGEH